MKKLTFAATALALAAALPAQAYVANLTSGPDSAVAGVVTETFSGAPVFARTGNGTVYTSTSPGMVLTADDVYLLSGLSAQPKKGVLSPDDPWFSVAAGGAASFAFDGGTNYVGFLWGSVDDFNTVSFYDGATLLASFAGGPGGMGVNQVAVGDGDQGKASYLNFFATSITSMTLTSLGNAFEIDNVSARTVLTRLDEVPEPGALALVAAALGAAALVRRRRAQPL